MRCKKHPKYKGILPPVDCVDCAAIYEAKHSLNAVRKAKKDKDEKKELRHSLDLAIEKVEEFEKHVAAIRALRESRLTYDITPRESTHTSEATAIACATDWHFGSRIKPEQVNYKNQFDVAIAKQRINTFFERVVRLIRKERQDVKLTDLILFLGGDLINGSLHADTMMSDEIARPIDQAVECQALIESGLNFILNHAKLKSINVLCADGNHGRITTKQQWTSRQGNALEYYMYYNISKRFPTLNWVFAPGILIYQKVYGFNVRFHHGDTIHFGGIKGPAEYLVRALHFWDTAIPADYSIQGHLHTYNLGTRQWLVNGSLIGYSPFGIAMRGEFQPPIQAFCLIDKKRGPTVQIPILL